MTFQALRQSFGIPSTFQFRYWQLEHTFEAQFPAPLILEPDSIERLLTSSVMGKPLSTLYLYLTVEYDAKLTKTWEKWRVDIPSLDEEEWKECLISYIPSMIAAKDRFIQFKFLHRACFTPQRLACIYHQRDPNCQRCRQEVGTFWHMVWSCPKIRPFWSAVASTLSKVIGSSLPVNPQILLLSHLEDVVGDRYTKLSNLHIVLR